MTGYLGQQDENVPLAAMDNQLVEMDRDYNVMLMERIESKKQLEAKFQDIQRKIQANRDFTKAEEKRVNDTLKAFRARFEHKLRMLREKFEAKINAMRELNRRETRNADERLDRLENAIAQEVEDRVTETDEQINQTQDTLNRKSWPKTCFNYIYWIGLQNQFDGEVQTRIEREKDIMQEVDNSKYNLHKKLDQERTDKALKLGAFKESTNN